MKHFVKNLKKRDILLSLLLPCLILVNLMPLFGHLSVMAELRSAFSINFSLYLIIFALLIIVQQQKRVVSNTLYEVLSYLSSAVFSLYLVLGEIYRREAQFYSANHIGIYFVIFFLKILAITYLVKLLLDLIMNWLNYVIPKEKIHAISDNFSFARSWIIMLICWLPYVLIIYPASSNPDTSNQIVEFFGKGVMVRDVYPIGHYLLGTHPFSISNQHNFFVTCFYGACMKIGLVIFHSANVGFFITAIIQLLLVSIVLVYSLKTLGDININPHKVKIIEMIYRFFPLFPVYSLYLVKNVLYSAFVVLYLCLVLQLIDDTNKLKNSSWQFIFILSIFGQLITQKYAFILIVVSVFLFLIVYRSLYKQVLLVFALPLLLFRIGIEGVLFSGLQVPKGDPIEGQGIMIQQTALCVKKHSSSITKNEYKILNRVFVVKRLGRLYNPEDSNPIKSSGAVGVKKTVYRYKTVTRKDLKKYYYTWLKMATEYPGTYAEAALHLGYRYVDINSPSSDSSSIMPSDSLPLVTNHLYYLKAQVHQNRIFLPVRAFMARIYNFLNKIPPFGFLFQGSFYVWLTIIFLLYGLYLSDKNIGNILIFGSNLLLQVPIYMMSSIDNNSRYFLPFVFSIGLLIALPEFLNNEFRK